MGTPNGWHIRFGRHRFSPDTGVLEGPSGRVVLPPRAAEVLRCLLAADGRVVSRAELEAAAFAGRNVTRRSVPEAVLVLRRALGDDSATPRFIETVPRRGYRFRVPVRRDSWRAFWAAAMLAFSGSRRQRLAGALLLLCGLAVGVAVGLGWPRPQGPAAVQLSVALADPLVFDARSGLSLAISSDGRRIAYVGRDASGDERLHVLDLRRGVDRVVSSRPAKARNPLFAPDGRSVAYFSGGYLWRVEVTGGAPERLCEVGRDPLAAGTWVSSDRIVLSRGTGAGLSVCVLASGTLRELTHLGPEERAHLWPRFGAYGRVLFNIATRGREHALGVGVVDLGSGRTRRLAIADVSQPCLWRADRLAFVRDGLLWDARYDVQGEQIHSPRKVLGPLWQKPHRGAAGFAVAGDGTVLAALDADPPRGLFLVEPLGGRFRLPGLDVRVEQLRTTRNHGLIAVVAGGDVLVWSATAQSTRVLVAGPSDERNLVWNAEGTGVYLASDREGSYAIYEALIGSRQLRPVLSGPNDMFPDDLVIDEAALVYEVNTARNGSDLWVRWLDDGRSRPLVVSPGDDREARISPDGGWLAFVSDPSGIDQVFVQHFPDGAGRVRVSRGPGVQPRWAPDGNLVYLEPPDRVVRVQWRGSGHRLLQRSTLASVDGIGPFDITSQGEGLVFGFRAGAGLEHQVALLQRRLDPSVYAGPVAGGGGLR